MFARLVLGGATALLGVLVACAPAPQPAAAPTGDGSAAPVNAPPGTGRAPRPGTTPVALTVAAVYENTTDAVYFPLEGLAGCAWADDATLIICDEMRGKVFGLDSSDLRWYEFDTPPGRPYRPLDVTVDGFKVLVLDRGGGSVYRFDLNGSYLDRVLDVTGVDPAVRTDPSAFDVDRDGRMVIADVSEQQLVLLDAFLEPTMRLGDPGTHDDQLRDPSGVVFLPDGSIVTSDRGNRRLSMYGRLGFFERTVGGDYHVDNPFMAPQGLDCDRFGNLFVADQGSGLIHVLDRRQRLLFSAGAEFDLRAVPQTPVDVAVGPDGYVAVTDRARGAILVYRIIYE